MPKCTRTDCRKNGATMVHTQTGKFYCPKCAAAINAQPGQAGLVVLPDDGVKVATGAVANAPEPRAEDIKLTPAERRELDGWVEGKNALSPELEAKLPPDDHPFWDPAGS